VIENLCPNPSALMSSIDDHLIHISDRTCAPQVALRGQRTKANNLPARYSTDVHLTIRGERAIKRAPKRIQFKWLTWPELAQERHDAFKVFRTAFTDLNHVGGERVYAA